MADARLICALDVPDVDRAVELVEETRDSVGVFKVGLQLLHAAGFDVFRALRAAGAGDIFYDAKLLDIPNTMAGAMEQILHLKPWAVTLHAAAGRAPLEAAVATAARAADARPKLLAVTLLTSVSEASLHDEIGVPSSAADHVARMARMAQSCGCDGVIAAATDVAAVRRALTDPGFLVVVPGIRGAGADAGDQARVGTAADAIASGASHIVVGRTITASACPREAAARLAAEIAGL